MKIIVAGCGKVGMTLTRQLCAEGYDITVIDSDSNLLSSLVSRYDVMPVQGNCASLEVLQEAGIESADLLIAVTNLDEINLLCCLTAHQVNDRLHTIARIRNPEYSGQIYTLRDAFALSMTINPELQAAAEIERLLKYPGFLQRDSFVKDRAVIVELRVDEKSILKSTPLKNMSRVAGCKVLVCAVLRNGVAAIPDGEFVLKEGDRIFVTAPTDDLTNLLGSLGIITHRLNRVMICGGGRISYYLARSLLSSGIATTIVEKDYDRCLQLAQALPKANIVHGDASSQDLLESEGVRKQDALVSLTGQDELNMVVSLYGSKLGIPQVITKLAHMENPQILSDLPLGSIVNPKILSSNTIVSYVLALSNKTGTAVSVHTIADGQVEATEFRLDEHAKHCGKPLKDLHLKKNVLIVGIGHGGQLVIPGGDSIFHLDDSVVVVSAQKKRITQFNDIFED